MYQQQLPPRRRPWMSRHKFLSVCITVGAVLIVGGILRSIPSGPAARDYRDPAQLAEAMKKAEHAYSASCGKLPGGKYFCAVGFTDGTSGTYTVTVAADGKSYQTD